MRRSPSQRRKKNQRRPRAKKKLLRHLWRKPGRRPWKSTGLRARRADSGHRQPRSGGTGRVPPRGGRAARVGGGPRTTRRATLRTTAGAPNPGVTGGVARSPGRVPVPRHRLLRATARAKKRPSQTSSKRCPPPPLPLCWRSWASARTRCSRSATTGPRASRRSRPAARMGARRGHRVATGPGPTGGVVEDVVARDLQGPPGPPCLRNGAARDPALSHGVGEGRTEAHPRDITTGAGEASVPGGGTGACRPRGKTAGGCTPLHPTGGRSTGRA